MGMSSLALFPVDPSIVIPAIPVTAMAHPIPVADFSDRIAASMPGNARFTAGISAGTPRADRDLAAWLRVEEDLIAHGWGENGRPSTCPSATPLAVIRGLKPSS
jgi:hypothetical protein